MFKICLSEDYLFTKLYEVGRLRTATLIFNEYLGLAGSISRIVRLFLAIQLKN